MDGLRGEVLVAGKGGRGTGLMLTAPISFWGGVNPDNGDVADPRHPQYGQSITGRVLFVPATIGSSSASAILLELVRNNRAPAAIVLHEPDAILLLGLIVAREMGYDVPIAVKLPRDRYADFDGKPVVVSGEGVVTLET